MQLDAYVCHSELTKSINISNRIQITSNYSTVIVTLILCNTSQT